MWRLIAAAFLAAFFACRIGPAIAAACVPPAEIVRQVLITDPEARIARVTGEKASRMGAAITQATGLTMTGEAHYLVIASPSRPYVIVARFQNGCVTHHGRFPAELIRRWLEGQPT